VLVAADEDPVWFSQRSSAAPGFEREVLEGFARLHKLRFEIVPVPRWDEAIPMLLRQAGDVLGGISNTPERRQKVDFTIELLPARSIVVTHRPKPPIRSLAQLRCRARRDRAEHGMGGGAREDGPARLAHAARGRTSRRRSRRSAWATPTRR
jgi:hypothetical protein